MKNLLTVTFLFFGIWLVGQSNMSYFLGLHPSFVKEKFYEANEIDINIIPLVFQTPINKHIDVRGTCYYTYHFGNENSLADTGLELAFPVFFTNKKESKNEFSKGFYFSPTIGFGRNFLNDHNTLTLSAEPGYMFNFKNKFGLTVYLQYGGSHFNYSGTEEDVWRQHFGIKVNLGLWNLFG